MGDEKSDLQAASEIRISAMGIRVTRADGTVEDWGREEYDEDEDGNVTTRGKIAPPTFRIRVRNEMLKLRNSVREAIR